MKKTSKYVENNEEINVEKKPYISFQCTFISHSLLKLMIIISEKKLPEIIFFWDKNREKIIEKLQIFQHS